MTSTSLRIPRLHRWWQLPAIFLACILLISISVALRSVSAAAAAGPQTAAASRTSGDLHTGAAKMLRMAVDYLEEGSQVGSSSGDVADESSVGSVMASHARDVASSLYLPIDYLVHLAHSDESAAHPLHRSYEVAMAMVGLGPLSAPLTASVEETTVAPLPSHTDLHFSVQQEKSNDDADKLSNARVASSVRVRSPDAPLVFFNSDAVTVTDLATDATFSVACTRCGAEDVSLVVQSNTTHSFSTNAYAYQDLYGIGEVTNWIPVNVSVDFTADVSVNPLPRVQPDLSQAGWSARGEEIITVAWLDPISLEDPSRLQVIHFAVHLAPLRYWQAARSLRWDFLTDENDTFSVANDSSATGEYSFSELIVEPTIFCSVSGKIANASRTLYSCNTTADNATLAQPYADYSAFTNGSLLDVFQSEPDVQLDPSITATLTCDGVWAWFESERTFLDAHVDPDANYTQQQTQLDDACTGVIANSSYSIDDPLRQYCQLFTRCFARDYLCHQWIDVSQFCICPFDRTGDHCESFTAFQCDIELVYPSMDVQTYRDSAGAVATYSCPAPRAFHSRLPSTVDNPGANSSVIAKPQTDMQQRYAYLPFLDGDAPCIDYPSTSSNPSVSNPADDANPTGTQELRYAVDCKFTPDNDLTGVMTTSLPPSVPPTWSHIKQAPSDAIVQLLTDGGYTWDSDYDHADGGWSYDIVRTQDNGTVVFAVSLLSVSPLQLSVHPQNFVRIHDDAFDLLSAEANSTILESPPSAQTIRDATRTGDASLLANSTLGVRLNVTSLPESYWRGGRYLVETTFRTFTARNFDTARATAVFPRGMVGNEYPCRFFLERSTYTLQSASSTHGVSLVGAALLCLLAVGVLGAAYKYYVAKREEEFQRILKLSRARAKRREQQEERVRMERQLHEAGATTSDERPAAPSPAGGTTRRHDTAE